MERGTSTSKTYLTRKTQITMDKILYLMTVEGSCVIHSLMVKIAT